MAIISTEMAAGVIPSMRDVCPSEVGLIEDSFSFSSFERPCTLLKSKASGIFIISRGLRGLRGRP